MFLQILKIISLAAFLVALNLIAPPKNETNSRVNEQNRLNEVQEVLGNEKIHDKPLWIKAQAACVFDIFNNQSLFELNPVKPVPLASLTKLMTAIVARENFFKETLIEISPEAILQEGDNGLNVGERWSLSELIEIMLVTSSNDAAFAIASSLSNSQTLNDSRFVDWMNNKASTLNFKQTHFFNATGLDISADLAGAYGSCKDMVSLMQYIIKVHPDILESTTEEFLNLRERIFKNTNDLVPKLPFFLGGKTGFSDLAGGNLVIIADKGLNHPVVIIVLGSTEEDRFKDAEILYNKYIHDFKHS